MAGHPLSLFVVESLHSLNDHVLDRDILVLAKGAGFDISDFVYDVHALDHLPENGITESHGRGIFLIEKVVVLDIDEKLGSGAMNKVGSRHGNRSTVISQSRCCLVLYRIVRLLLLHVGGESTSLNHEIADNTMENRAVVKAFVNIAQKIGDTDRGFMRPELDFDRTFRSLNCYRSI
jgi:hypothetical protein